MLEFVHDIVAKINGVMWSYVLIALLIGAGLFFTVKLRFVQFRMVGEMFRLLGDGFGGNKENKSVSSFQAFTMSTASRVGTGNLAGVATAIVLGGPGAVFWMWVIALIGSASGFIESTLAQIYKVKDGDAFRGGPAYYMERALKNRGLGVAFAILITVCFGFIFNALQANTIAAAFSTSYSINPLYIGIGLAILTAFIIFGGVHRIAFVTSVIVPVMALFYLGVAILVTILNIGELGNVIALVIKSAFGMEQAVGGAIGAAILNGIKRGLFSNEAGMGSAPNAAATASVSHPVKQGLIQTLGVFTDTLIICTATAFIVLFSGEYTGTAQGIELTQIALASQIGSWAPTFISVCIFLFAFSSIVGNYYYGESNIEFIKASKGWLYGYRVVVIAMVIFGSVASIQLVWDLSDLFMGFMALINIYAILRLYKIAKLALDDYLLQKKAGVDPVFYNDTIPGLEGVEAWPTKEEANSDVK